jgi:hypothetical protein
MSESDTDPALSDLGPMPDAEAEPGEVAPGGADAVVQPDGSPGAEDDEPLTHDLHPDDNPVTGEIPLEVKQTEDTSTEATKGEGSEGDSYDGDEGDQGAEEVETE